MTSPEAPSLPGPALLFCPADRPDRYAKALAAADSVILDLEDGVGAAGKDAARAALLATPVDPERVIVRINAVGSPEFEALHRRIHDLLFTDKIETDLAPEAAHG